MFSDAKSIIIIGLLAIMVGLLLYMRKREKELMARMGMSQADFLTIVSHQFRTPLSTIKGYISMMLEGRYGEEPADRKKILDIVYISNEKLIKLVNDLFDLVRFESDETTFEFKHVLLENVASEAVESMRPVASAKKLQLHFEKPTNHLPEVNADHEEIKRVMQYLIDNAIQFSKQGGVHVEVRQVNHEVRFCVIDNGVGMTKEDQSKLFHRFGRADNASRSYTEGRGISLYIAKLILRAHHGQIWGFSQGQKQGSTFCFSLPLAH